jgi:hypothetical protein
MHLVGVGVLRGISFAAFYHLFLSRARLCLAGLHFGFDFELIESVPKAFLIYVLSVYGAIMYSVLWLSDPIALFYFFCGSWHALLADHATHAIS